MMTAQRVYYKWDEINVNRNYLIVAPGFLVSKVDYYTHAYSHPINFRFVNPVYRYIVGKGYIKIVKNFSVVITSMNNMRKLPG